MSPKPPSGALKIAVRGIRKSFGRKVVLDGLDLDVGVGESVVVIGGSGTGKSVLVKCIIGLMQADGGSIKIDGEEMVGRSASERIKSKCNGMSASGTVKK
jgi:phospholipid/cholesterol/gamma-HCH transport system ATP-binding protein